MGKPFSAQHLDAANTTASRVQSRFDKGPPRRRRAGDKKCGTLRTVGRARQGRQFGPTKFRARIAAACGALFEWDDRDLNSDALLGQQIFVPLSLSRPSTTFVVWTVPWPYERSRRPRPSSLYTFGTRTAWLGVVSREFAEFERIP